MRRQESGAQIAYVLMLCLAKKREDRPTALELLDGLLASGLCQQWTDQGARTWWLDHLPALMET